MNTPDAAFETLWKRVVDDWNNDAAHGAFLEHCQNADLLHEAAVRYRGMTGDSERGASAQKRLQALSLLALARLETARSSPGFDGGRTVTRIVLILFFLAMSVALLLYAAR